MGVVVFNSNFFKIYILPGITFQSIVISGGYCTGQEIVQYFLSLGPVNGFYGLLITTALWSVICALCFLLAKAYDAYDYKTFFKVLLGRGWILFELSYLYLVVIALSVISASVGSMLQDLLGIPYVIGLLLPFVYIGVMLCKGSKSIEKMFSWLSILLYTVFITFLICCYQKTEIKSLAQTLVLPTGLGWVTNGIKYASYNVGCIIPILFTLRYIKSTKQAIVSGILAGPIASIPGILLFMALVTEYPNILNTTVPSTYLLDKLAIPLLTLAFSMVLIATLVETGVGLVHAFKERITLTKNKIIPVIALLSVAMVLSQFGLVNLIVRGYGLLTWFMIAVFILPLLTIGLYKMRLGSVTQTLEVIGHK